MKKRFWYRSVFASLACMTLALGIAPFAGAEKVDLPAVELRRISTHVIVGKVLAVRHQVETEGEYRYIRYVAQVKIGTVEKGADLCPGEVCEVRYWHRTWQPQGETLKKVTEWRKRGMAVVRPDTQGHRGKPGVGDTMRIYLARNAYDGFYPNNNDGAYHVIGANGFQKL